jgi:hypothetical protein
MFKLDYSYKGLIVRYVEAILSRPNAGNPDAILNEAERMALVTFAAFAELDKGHKDKPEGKCDRVDPKNLRLVDQPKESTNETH